MPKSGIHGSIPGRGPALDQLDVLEKLRRAKNPSIVRFLQAWANDPIPQHILDAGAEIMAMDDYAPEKRVHQIVQKCVTLWIEADHDDWQARGRERDGG